MEVMLILIPVTMALVGVALWSFIWSVKNDQFDDLDKEAYSILFDDPVSDSGADSRPDNKVDSKTASNTAEKPADRNQLNSSEVAP